MKIIEPMTNKLLVEGNDDFHLILHLCENFSVEENFEVVDCKGRDNILSTISSRIKFEDTCILGIVLDCDSSLSATLGSLKSILNPLGFEINDVPQKDGYICKSLEYPEKKVGVWLMPDNIAEVGMIEDFTKKLIPFDDPLKNEVEKALKIIESSSPRLAKYSDIHKSKAYMHTWLAWQNDPGTPIGLAVKKKYYDLSSETCSIFIRWLKLLYTSDI